MDSKFLTILYGSLDDLDSILDREEMNEAELRAALQRLLREIQNQNARLGKLEVSRG